MRHQTIGKLALVAAVAVQVFLAKPVDRLGQIPGLGEYLSFGYAAQLSAALNAQAELTPDLLNRAGVVGTAVGFDAAGKPVVKVYLERAGVQAVPESFAGVGVTTEVTGKIYALGHAPEDVAAAEAESVNPRGRFSRPVPIGVSTGQPDVTAGTIGARATNGSDVFALSNNHVFANRNLANKGDNILQPGVADGGSSPDAIATLHDFEEIYFCSGVVCRDNKIDAAIAITTPDNLKTETPENGYGTPRSNPMGAKLGLQVQKYGRTTGHTRGKVTGINATVNVNYRTGTARFVGQIMIAGNSETFSQGGDSGSLIVSKALGWNDRRPVGLLFAGSATNTIANPIDLVLDRFKITIEGG